MKQYGMIDVTDVLNKIDGLTRLYLDELAKVGVEIKNPNADKYLDKFKLSMLKEFISARSVKDIDNYTSGLVLANKISMNQFEHMFRTRPSAVKTMARISETMAVAEELTSIAQKLEEISTQVVAAPVKIAAAPKKKASFKKALAKMPETGKETVLDTVLGVIGKSHSGVDIATLKVKTNLESRQLSNALYKLSKKKLIKSKSKGVYIKKGG